MEDVSVDLAGGGVAAVWVRGDQLAGGGGVGGGGCHSRACEWGGDAHGGRDDHLAGVRRWVFAGAGICGGGDGGGFAGGADCAVLVRGGNSIRGDWRCASGVGG